MNDNETRGFHCPRCRLPIGQIEPDGALFMVPGIRIAHADFVCMCGKAIHWHSHEMAMERLVARVLALRGVVSIQETENGGTDSPDGMLT